jgi:hypothetical protein
MDGGSYAVNISPPGSTYLPYAIREILTVEETTYKNITKQIKNILEKEHFLDYFSSTVKVHTDSSEYDTNIYISNQLSIVSVLPNRYIFIALPITTLKNIYPSDNPPKNIRFYIPLLIDIQNNTIYDVTDEPPAEIAYTIDYYFKTMLGFAFTPKSEYGLTMLACQFLPYPDISYGIMTATGYIGVTGTEHSGATAGGTVIESYNPTNNKFDGLSIGYTFYEK